MLTFWQRPDAHALLVSSLVEDAWAYVTEPDDAELDALVRDHRLERDLLQDALDPNEVPRVQQEGDATYFFLRAPKGAGDQTKTVPLLVALTPSFLLTMSREQLSWLERFREAGPYNTAWRSQLVWRIMLALVARYQSSINDIAKHVRSDLAAIERIRNEDLVRLVGYEGVLNDLLASLAPMQAMLANLAAGKAMKVYDEDKDLMEDVVLGTAQAVEAANAALKTTANVREAYALVAANDLNRFIKLLTSLSLIMTVPNLIVNFWSMNIALPLQRNPHMFAIMVVATLAIAGGLSYVFWRRRLL